MTASPDPATGAALAMATDARPVDRRIVMSLLGQVVEAPVGDDGLLYPTWLPLDRERRMDCPRARDGWYAARFHRGAGWRVAS